MERLVCILVFTVKIILKELLLPKMNESIADSHKSLEKKLLWSSLWSHLWSQKKFQEFKTS